MAKSLAQRRLGAKGPSVSSIGLGCMSLSGAYGDSDDAAAINLVHHAIDIGVNFLDTSDFYGWGHNEKVIGEALKGRRDKVVLASKFGIVKTAAGVGEDGRPEYVQMACEESLTRLGVDVIDLYYQHRVDASVPIEETVGAMARLVKQGKVRHIGLCEVHPRTIERAHKIYPLTAVQTEYSLLYRSEAEETLQTTRSLGIAFVAYSPLGRGLLTGSIVTQADVASGRRGQYPRFMGENLDHNRGLVSRVQELAEKKGCSVGQLSLAWLLAQGQDIIPIPGTKRRDRLDENIGALDVILSPSEVAAISAAIPPGSAAGSRYPEKAMQAVYR